MQRQASVAPIFLRSEVKLKVDLQPSERHPKIRRLRSCESLQLLAEAQLDRKSLGGLEFFCQL